MKKRIIKFFKKMLVSSFLLYGYNVIAAPLSLIIPINFVTVLLVTLFGIPVLFSLITILIIGF